MSGATGSRVRRHSCLPNNRPHWDGAPLPGATLLLIADQGFGDAIQFCRYIPWVCARCPQVVVVADPLMHPLIRQTHPAFELVGSWDRCPPFAAYCPLSGLPRLHGTTLDTIPSKVPYLHADPARTRGLACSRAGPASTRRSPHWYRLGRQTNSQQ